MDVARARAHAVAAASLVGMLLAGCSSGTPAPLSSPASSGPVGSLPAPAASSIPPSGATATAKASKGGVISVDLAITGTLPLTLHGTAGQCSIGHRPDGTGVFQYFANPGDFPGIGQGLFLTESRLGSDPSRDSLRNSP